jgi:hypothetical protein
MMKNISSIFSTARNKLTRLGLCLFYFYMLLALLGCMGVIFGITTVIQNLIFFSSGTNTAWWEVIALILVSWFMTKIFLLESFKLVDLDGSKTLHKPDDTEEEQKKSISNVIPFNKNCPW